MKKNNSGKQINRAINIDKNFISDEEKKRNEWFAKGKLDIFLSILPNTK